MTTKKQHNVGERFEMCKLIYEVRECDFCDGCSLLNEEEGICMDENGLQFEPCSESMRIDGKGVIFVQVGEAED